MTQPTRRSILRGSMGLVAAGAFAAPYVANAQAKTATVWWVQGFAHEEDIAFQKLVAEYQKASGNTIDASIIPYAPVRQKIVAAMTSGEVPDLFQNNPPEITALMPGRTSSSMSATSSKRRGRIIRIRRSRWSTATTVSQRSAASTACLIRSMCLPTTSGSSLVEKAGYKMDDIPKTWDAFYDFFKGVQKKLREAGVRRVYGLGFQVTTNGGDPNAFFDQWLIAYGGQNIVGHDGKLHLDDPEVREAAMKALTYPTTAYKEGFVPPSAINWNDADDNNAFHAKTIVMDLDGSISTEVAIMNKKQEYDDIVTWGLADSNDGKPVPSWAFSVCGLIPKGAKNVAVGEGFPEISDPAGGAERIPENGAGPPRAGNAVDRQDRPLVDGRSAPQGLYDASTAAPNRAGVLGLQSGLCPGPERACLADRLGRHHPGRHDPAAGRREGIQADRGDLREISDRSRAEHLVPADSNVITPVP